MTHLIESFGCIVAIGGNNPNELDPAEPMSSARISMRKTTTKRGTILNDTFHQINELLPLAAANLHRNVLHALKSDTNDFKKNWELELNAPSARTSIKLKLDNGSRKRTIIFRFQSNGRHYIGLTIEKF